MKTGEVYIDIMESPLFSIRGGFVFYFSSEFYKKKYETTCDEYVKNEKLKLQNRYGIKLNCELYLYLSYYKKIEKRGFRVYDDITKKEITPFIVFSNTFNIY